MALQAATPQVSTARPASPRYNIRKADGRLCCQGDDYSKLCAACRAQVDSCTCGHCRAERAARPQQQQASGLFAGLLQNNSGTVPPPPSLESAIREAHGLAPTAEPRVQANGVPEPPDLAAAIRAAQGERR